MPDGTGAASPPAAETGANPTPPPAAAAVQDASELTTSGGNEGPLASQPPSPDAAPAPAPAEPAGPAPAPGQWLVFEGAAGAIAAPFEGAMTELLAVSSESAGREPPFRLSDGAFDAQFWLSWWQSWSPDGKTLVFDASNGFEDEGFESRLYYAEFGANGPTPPRRIENLPIGGELIPGAWNAQSSALPVQHGDELYVVRREADGSMVATLAATQDSSDAAICGSSGAVLLGDAGLTIVPDSSQAAARALAGVESFSVSPAGSKIAALVASPGADPDLVEYSLSVLPCALEGEAVELARSSDFIYVDFSPDSRWLVVDTASDAPLELFDLRELAQPAWPLPGATSASYTSYTWTRDSSSLWLQTDSGQLQLFDLAARRSTPLASQGSFAVIADRVVVQREDAQAGTSFELLEPRPEAKPQPILQLAAGEGTLRDVRWDAALAHGALLLEDDRGLHLRLISLTDPAQASSFDFPSGTALALGDFSGDGRGLPAWIDDPSFELYWLAVDAPPGAAPVRLYAAAAGALLAVQPWK